MPSKPFFFRISSTRRPSTVAVVDASLAIGRRALDVAQTRISQFLPPVVVVDNFLGISFPYLCERIDRLAPFLPTRPTIAVNNPSPDAA